MKIFYFVSVPRTATHSVRKMLKFGDRFNHRSARFIRDKVGKKSWEGAFTFAFARNPYDRLMSWYFYHRDNQKIPIYQVPFKEWIMSGIPHHWTPTTTFGGGEMPNPHSMCEYLLDEDGRVMVDFVGKVETFGRDYREVCRLLETEAPDTILRVNTSSHLSRHTLYDADMIEKVKELLGRDLDMFGYEF